MVAMAEDLPAPLEGLAGGTLRKLPLPRCQFERPDWVDTSSWQDGEAAVRPCLTLERQVTNTLLPDCAFKPPAAKAEDLT